MKKLVYFVGLVLAVSACHVRHDHSKQMQHVRVPVDTAQNNYVDDDRVKAEAEAAEDEGLTVLPQNPIRDNVSMESSTIVEQEIERMMKGEDMSGED